MKNAAAERRKKGDKTYGAGEHGNRPHQIQQKNLVQERAFGIFYRLGGDCAGDQRFDRGDHL